MDKEGVDTYCGVLCCAVLSHSVMSDSCDPIGYSLPGSSVHGDSPGKNTSVGCHALLALLKGSSQLRDLTQGSCTAGRFFTS